MNDLVIYEQPLTEYIRICLRLEKLFNQIEHVSHKTIWDSTLAVEGLMEILSIAERSDLKSRLAQALTSQSTKLSQLSRNPQVDADKLNVFLGILHNYMRALHDQQNRFGHSLRDNSLLSTVKQQAMSQGGLCVHNIPVFQLWLQNTPEKRFADFLEWMKQLSLLRDIVNTLLNQARDYHPMVQKEANNGFYQQSLQTQPPIVLIRVGIPAESRRFAVTSVGKHRLSVTFYQMDADGADSYSRDEGEYPFYLACCT